jgi:hypothetical protein
MLPLPRSVGLNEDQLTRTFTGRERALRASGPVQREVRPSSRSHEQGRSVRAPVCRESQCPVYKDPDNSAETPFGLRVRNRKLNLESNPTTRLHAPSPLQLKRGATNKPLAPTMNPASPAPSPSRSPDIVLPVIGLALRIRRGGRTPIAGDPRPSPPAGACMRLSGRLHWPARPIDACADDVRNDNPLDERSG